MNSDKINILKRGLVDIIREDEFDSLLASDSKRIYFGIDPTGPNIHLGHMVVLKKLKILQELGHKIIFLIGDFTAMIGDPTDRESMRQPLTREEVLINTQDYIMQASRIIPMEDLNNPVEVRFNSDWHAKQNLATLLNHLSLLTLQQVVERDMFQERIKNNRPISLSELIYPYLQGYDAVVLEADCQIGGTDQTFNMLMGRTLRQKMADGSQIVITVPLIPGTDGRKMSKSFNNTINITDTANDIFGKVMSLNDDLILTYFSLLTDVTNSQLADIENKIKQNPREQKVSLAKQIIGGIYGQEEADQAADYFDRVFVNKELPEDIASYNLDIIKDYKIIDCLDRLGAVVSKSDAHRLIDQGGIKFNNEKISSIDFIIKEPGILQIGKRKFIKIISE
jgi:tyrosyl-tRNA synthetase